MLYTMRENISAVSAKLKEIENDMPIVARIDNAAVYEMLAAECAELVELCVKLTQGATAISEMAVSMAAGAACSK